jgi:hypothetical protein
MRIVQSDNVLLLKESSTQNVEHLYMDRKKYT